MASVMAGEATPSQLAGLLAALAVRGETVDEIAGFAAGLRAAAVPVEIPDGAIDTCGTGGDRSHSFNISTVAAIVAAAAGARVAKHGNRAASSACGSADVLEALGVKIDLGADGVAACVNDVGVGFMFAPRFHPAMRHAGPVRREIGIRTIFNVLGPLANPAGVKRQLLGVPSPFRACAEPGDRRRRRRLVPLEGRSGAEPGEATTGASTASTALASAGLFAPSPAAERRRRRLRCGAGLEAAPTGTGASVWSGAGALAADFLRTLAPTSPSAQRAPPAVCTSTRQTTIAVGSSPTGARFWVRVQRA